MLTPVFLLILNSKLLILLFLFVLTLNFLDDVILHPIKKNNNNKTNNLIYLLLKFGENEILIPFYFNHSFIST